MEFVENILEAKGSELLEALTGGAGFTTAQAEKFLPEAGGAIGRALKSKVADLDVSEPSSPSNIGALMSAVDVGGLARRTGVSSDQTLKGLDRLVPMLLGFLADKAGGAASILGPLEGHGGALSALKGLGNRFLK